ncbi:MAG: hypothetical protein AB8G86_09825 [Saprospiraceae bacterium]
MDNLDWQKVAKTFMAFALANLIYDYWSMGIFDVYKTLGIPFIAIVLIYLVDRKRLVKEEG